ncbi:hypothetical protein [Actinomadura atramentaria]|uniref:hypothetical protein n=1 Tax=Actinomadura atramentaria TaxID=1990 RepID=UPI00035EBE8F|nr:hypothetical protein [Actinomadura atramentaria]
METQDDRLLAAGAPLPPGAVDAGERPPAARVAELVAAGAPVAVTPAPDGPELLAEVAVYAWLGVRHLRVPDPSSRDVRDVLAMVDSVRGTRPPALSVRGLA